MHPSRVAFHLHQSACLSLIRIRIRQSKARPESIRDFYCLRTKHHEDGPCVGLFVKLCRNAKLAICLLFLSFIMCHPAALIESLPLSRSVADTACIMRIVALLASADLHYLYMAMLVK